ncbi:sigma-54-dependent Fis family transcriptional regulator [Kineobactrum sediminis]|uniref:Sigma-54-dependent Fis family transcriptional regulator n=1 Tax=Kineobactrum sediminis TaxID=1905677 RepID=A0A2N5XZP3_9GAMM|nr:sigma-54 dependent transcriptional regulator [Kineobactrum sediminis]PLW81620.1 sigma-54-dependent Fis family transcriptional regulator [Kineobactrum sediminis]
MSTQTVLIVDDEPDIRELLGITLSRMGLQSSSAATLQEAREKIQALQPDLCLTDMRLPDGNGISLVEYIQGDFPHIPVAMITAHGSVEIAISALKAGAFDFISKPIELERLRNLVSSALRLNDQPQPAAIAEHSTSGLVGNAPGIIALREQISKLARSQAPVHIHGESGVGKEVVARLIHSSGPRAERPFIAVNCGAIPPELMESEFFGHLKGSFSGANRDKLGLFQAAQGGTLFLDEVADLPLAMQVKLLRAIQEKAVRPVGASEEYPTDVRLLSATHKNLAAEVQTGYFRNDLYYRINVIDVHVPSLRERLEDLPGLAQVLLLRIAEASGASPPTLASSAMAALAHYHFPGNVRELENILERAFALAEGDTISARDLQLSDRPPVETRKGNGSTGNGSSDTSTDVEAAYGNLEAYLEDIERQILSAALEQCRWNKTATAKLLGISFRSLRYRLQKLKLED